MYNQLIGKVSPTVKWLGSICILSVLLWLLFYILNDLTGNAVFYTLMNIFSFVWEIFILVLYFLAAKSPKAEIKTDTEKQENDGQTNDAPKNHKTTKIEKLLRDKVL